MQCQLNGVDDAQVTGASAEVATQLLPYPVAPCRRKTIHDVIRDREHARGTETTLQRVALAEAFADDVHDWVAAIAFNGAHVGAVGGRCKHDAGSHRLTIHQKRAGAADTMLAAKMRPS